MSVERPLSAIVAVLYETFTDLEYSHNPWMLQSDVASSVPGFLIFSAAVAEWWVYTGPSSAPSTDSPWAENSKFPT
jgi:hypothetical protein